MRRDMKKELDRLFAICGRHKLPLTRRPGATEEEIAWAEQKTGIQFDEDLRELYRFSNGGDFIERWFAASTAELQPFRFYPLADVCQVHGWVTEPACDPIRNNGGVPWDPRVQRLDRHTRWLPFADFRNGDAILYLDDDPTELGRKGQIISWHVEPEAVRWCARDLIAFLKQSNDLLDANWAELTRF